MDDPYAQWRPTGITALGFLMMGSSLPLFTLMILGLPALGLEDVLLFRILFAIGGAILLAAGIGLLMLKRWARFVALFVGALLFLSSLIYFTPVSIITAIIGGLLIWYVYFNKTVEDAFTKSKK